MTSSLKALLYMDPGFYFEANHFTFVLEIPQMTVALPEPVLRWKHYTSPATWFQGGKLIWIWKKLRLVRTEFPGVASLPWNSDLSGSTLNASRIKEGAKIIRQIARRWDNSLEL